MKNSLSHISFIMDGNNRWSKKKSYSKYSAYKKGADKLLKLSNFIFSNTSAEYLSAFALSKNNLKRPSLTIKIIKDVLKETINEIEDKKLNFDIKFIGDFNFLNKTLRDQILEINNNNVNSSPKLIIFLNYGGREDINGAFRTSKSNKKSTINKYLLTNNIPDPDILIRTGGYQRLSNFMLYQLAFTELFFIKKMWPDFSINDLKKVLLKYHQIKRKFGR